MRKQIDHFNESYDLQKWSALELAKPHFITALVGAVVAAAGAYANAQQQAANRRNQRKSAALSSLGSGAPGGAGAQPTALAMQAKQGGGGGDLNSLGIEDLLNQPKPEEQEFNLGESAGFSDAGQAPDPSGQQFKAFAGNELDPNRFNAFGQQQEPTAETKPPNDYGQYIDLASIVGGIAADLAKGPPAPPGYMPSPGSMNYQPTALAMLARRRGF